MFGYPYWPKSSWTKHVESIILKMAHNISILRTGSYSLTVDNRITVCRSIIEPYFNYCSIVWDSLADTLSEKLQWLQNRTACIISGLPYSVWSNEIRTRLEWSLDEILIQQENRSRARPQLFTRDVRSTTGLKNIWASELISKSGNSTSPNFAFKKQFLFTGAQIWNSLPESLKTKTQSMHLRTKLKNTDLHQQFKASLRVHQTVVNIYMNIYIF